MCSITRDRAVSILVSQSVSLDLNVFQSYNECPLLSESCSFGSISTSSLHDVPSFPAGSFPPISTILDSGSKVNIFPGCSPKIGSFYAVDETSPAMLSVPTPPRLKTMLKETLCVKKWVERLSGFDAPGHNPWSSTQDASTVSWVPEGSIYSPDTFRSALMNARNPNRIANTRRISLHKLEEPEEQSPAPRRTSYQPGRASYREALVFERKVILNASGQPQRWSLQVPATTMDSEMVDMMLELQGLSSFFKNGMQDDTDSGQKERLDPPTLMVSNSSSMVPLSLESSGNLAAESPLTLATRRGKKAPPPLSFKPEFGDDPYPSIPSAFLGSPSCYSPQFEFANHSGEPSLAVSEMITSLRSQCKFIPGGASHKPDHQEVPHIRHAEKPGPDTPRSDDSGDHEWSFARDLLATYGDSTRSATANVVTPGHGNGPVEKIPAGCLTLDAHGVCGTEPRTDRQPLSAPARPESIATLPYLQEVLPLRIHPRKSAPKGLPSLPAIGAPPKTPLPACPPTAAAPVVKRVSVPRTPAASPAQARLTPTRPASTKAAVPKATLRVRALQASPTKLSQASLTRAPYASPTKARQPQPSTTKAAPAPVPAKALELLRPALASPQRRAPGILKSRKSVRFASLPSRSAGPAPLPPTALPPRAPTPSVRMQPRSSLGALGSARSVAPSPALLTPAQHRRSAPGSTMAPKRLSMFTPAKVRFSGPATPTPVMPAPLAHPAPTTPAPASSAPVASRATASAPAPSTALLKRPPVGRHSLGVLPVPMAVLFGGKENKARASLSPARLSQRLSRTFNENDLRRLEGGGKGKRESVSGTLRSRMAVPLQNIFTRFK